MNQYKYNPPVIKVKVGDKEEIFPGEPELLPILSKIEQLGEVPKMALYEFLGVPYQTLGSWAKAPVKSLEIQRRVNDALDHLLEQKTKGVDIAQYLKG